MNEVLILALAFVAGAGLGMIFFAGLWWTVRKGLASKQPALWFFCSLLLRTSIVLVGFYFVGLGHWQRMVFCVLGFVIARFVAWRLIGPPVEPRKSPPLEVRHAP